MSSALAPESMEFDPLVDLYGVWTPELAERYLPIRGMPPAKYECRSGRLRVRPHLGAASSHPACELTVRSHQAARDLGGGAYTEVNVQLAPNSWVQPDFVVLRERARGQVWIPAHQVLLIGECGPPTNRGLDRFDEPTHCAAAGIEFFMRVEVSYERQRAEVTLLRLDGAGYQVHARALSGSRFETEVPFPLAFDPAELLED